MFTKAHFLTNVLDPSLLLTRICFTTCKKITQMHSMRANAADIFFTLCSFLIFHDRSLFSPFVRFPSCKTRKTFHRSLAHVFLLLLLPVRSIVFFLLWPMNGPGLSNEQLTSTWKAFEISFNIRCYISGGYPKRKKDILGQPWISRSHAVTTTNFVTLCQYELYRKLTKNLHFVERR